jgi:hypothetical protein
MGDLHVVHTVHSHHEEPFPNRCGDHELSFFNIFLAAFIAAFFAMIMAGVAAFTLLIAQSYEK